jgi:hypothetical protein
MSVRFEFEGMEEFEALVKEIGEFPEKIVTPSARAGAMIALKAAKENAPGGPDTTGNLKKGIIIKGERKRVRAKKVYDIMLDPKMTDIFRKKGKEKDAYYPSSMEFGFLTRNGRKIPGLHYLRRALDDNADAIAAKIFEKLLAKLDKLASKK